MDGNIFLRPCISILHLKLLGTGKRSKMTMARIICLFAVVIIAVSPVRSLLKGNINSICTRAVSHKQYYPRWPLEYALHSEWHQLSMSRPWPRGDNMYRTDWTTEETCCDGYVNNNGTCDPYCPSECVNGYCAEPNLCACNAGYEYVSEYKCDPVCKEACIHGKCESPDTCTCDPGYKHDADGRTCKPECHSQCEHGWCQAPNVCACHSGYLIKNETNLCVPVCEQDCVNGRCVAPNFCACKHGYQRSRNNTFICKPECREPCEFGDCTAPEICTCNEGYQSSSIKHICKPICQSACDNGWCLKPNVCECNSGYEKGKDNKCVPICDKVCANGTCVAPNICRCNVGYAKSGIDPFVCVPRCWKPCLSGRCTAPDTCTCNAGYEPGPHKYRCNPVCSSVCEQGYCAKPNVCECYPGYEKNGTNKCRPVCERPCINGKCVGADRCACNDGFQRSQHDEFICEPKCNDPCIFGSCTEPGICTCDSGYEMSSGSMAKCAPVCNESCSFGKCVAPNTCTCYFGFGGDSCEKRLFCVVTRTKGVNPPKLMSNVPEFTGPEFVAENSHLGLSACYSKCLDQLDSTPVNFTQTSGDAIHYFVPINAACNIFDQADLGYWRKNSGVMGTLIGVVLLAMVCCAVYIVRMKRKQKNDETSHPLVTEFVEVNPIHPENLTVS